MATNKDGFEVGVALSADELLTHMAKVRQAEKDAPAKLSKNAELIALLRNELSMQKVRLKPLGLESLAETLNNHFNVKQKSKKA